MVFIVFEGVDGAGKSTQLGLLAAALQGRGRSVVVTREPGGSPTLGAMLRQQLLHGEEIGPQAEALLFAADRAEHLRLLIEPALQQGSLVLCDRFVDSTLAYQGAGRGLAQDDLLYLCNFATRGRQPDLVVVCDLEPDVARARQTGRAAADRMEQADLGKHVRSLLQSRAAADPTRYVWIDADGTIEQVHERVLAAVLVAVAARIDPPQQ